jgi:predicted esterase/ketosteroid isomerase-like protein
MKRVSVILSIVLAALWPMSAAAQDKREQGTYAEMREYLGELVQQKQYAGAAAMLERALDRFPDHVRENTFNLAWARVQMGEGDKAMDALEKGLRRGIFYGIWDFDADAMAPLRKHARFPAFWKQNMERHDAAESEARMTLDVVTPPGYDPARRYPLFVALHGGGETIAVFKPHWVSPRLHAEFIVAYVQSSQVADMTGFHWQDESRTRRDLEAAYAQVVAKYPVDRDRVIVGGFSSGGFAALVTAFHQALPVRGFVALCPEVPTSITDADIDGAVKRGLRGSLLTTELDRRLVAQRALVARWRAANLDGEIVVTPNSGHWYPTDFGDQLDRAIGRILGPPAAVEKERATVEQTIHDNICWALTKNRALAERTMAHDASLFIFNPDSKPTIGWDELARNFTVWMDPRFKAVKCDIRELRVTVSRSGDVAWWSAILDDLAEWDGKPAGWKDTRWTGVLERRDSAWVIVQMHFSFAADKVRAEALATAQK